MTPCLIALFHLCVFDPSQVYLRGDVSTQIAGKFVYSYNGHKIDPLIGRLELGVYVPLSRALALRYGVAHASFIDQADRGEERAFLGFEWRPWN